MNSDNRCPNCRSTYNPDRYRIVNAIEMYLCHEIIKNREDEDSSGDEKATDQSDDEQHRKTTDHISSCEDMELVQKLKSTRIVQRNLVYLVGVPIDEANESFLKSPDMFGRYGELLKVVKNSNAVAGNRMSSVGLWA